VLRQFALKSLRYIIGKYGESFIDRSNKNVTESVTSDSIPYKTYLFPDYFTQGLLFSFEAEPNKNDSRSTPRFINENLNILGQNFIYLTTEWAYSGTSNLLFSQLVKFIEEYTNSEYTAIRNGEKGPFLLIKKSSQSNVLFDLLDFQEKSQAAGLIFSNQLIQRFVASLCTKPFVICSGLSGSGKTKLAQAFAQWITSDESQYVIVPVGADWTNREPLLGYPNALNKEEYVSPENGVLDLMVRAKQNIENIEEPTKPYFLILDEMNLSHVERYFADFLSTMESGDTIPLHKILPEPTKDLNTIPQTLKLPQNLFIIGTVNIDETTYMFSPKVLDRANTIEFRLTEKDLADFIASDIKLDMELLKAQGANMSDGFMAMALQKTDKNLKPSEADLKLFFSELKKSGAEFGYRTASEIGRLMYMLKELGESGDNLLDIAIMQKLLPKLHGSRSKLNTALTTLAKFCVKDAVKDFDGKDEDFRKTYFIPFDKLPTDSLDKIKYKISFEKISRMHKNAMENGFTSYAEA
jgi:MoxR-like ATPase